MPKKYGDNKSNKELILELKKLSQKIEEFEKDQLIHKKTEEMLKKSEEKFRTLSEQIPVGVYRSTSDGKILYANDSIVEILGYDSVEELLKVPIADTYVDQEEYSKHRDEWNENKDLVYNEVRLYKKNREIIWVRDNWKIIFGADGNIRYINGVLEDITERKHMEDTLRKNEEKFRLFFENNDAIILFVDPENGNIIFANNAAINFYGYSKDQLVGMHISDINALSKDEIGKKMIEAKKNKHNYFVFKHKLANGELRDVEIYQTKLVIGNDNIYSIFVHDITERKQAEKEKGNLQKQLIQFQKMEAIGTLAGGIAHDFNNMLGVIMGYTELTLDDPSNLKGVVNNLKRVMNASLRAKEMVEQIMAFSRKNEQTLRSVNVGEVISEVITFLRSTIPSTIEIKFDIEENLGLVLGNTTQLNQVLMNLCGNAAYSMKEDGGVLEIGLKEIILNKDSMVIENLISGRFLHLSVSDTGAGIPKEIINRIFEPYFTTKDEGEGTGMGLAVTYGIIRSYNGDIKVSSEPGKGTVFNIYIPVQETATEKDKNIKDKKLILGNNECVLFVDDEFTLVELSTEMLTSLGYQVDSRTSSVEALEAFKANPEKFDLIITDMTMPNMTGAKLTEEIHKIKPQIPVIICTGFSESINKSNFKDMGMSALIMKPIIKSDLSEAIREVLHKN